MWYVQTAVEQGMNLKVVSSWSGILNGGENDHTMKKNMVGMVEDDNEEDMVQEEDGLGMFESMQRTSMENTGVVINLPNKNALPVLSNDQWQTLVNLLINHKRNENEKIPGKTCEQIIDTGASNHMTGNIKLLHEMREITGCPVGLPD